MGTTGLPVPGRSKHTSGTRLLCALIVGGCAAPVGVALAWGPALSPPEWQASPPGQESSPTSMPPSRDTRLREGTMLVNQVGYFRVSGNRVVFHRAEGRGRFVALENLNLDRVSNAIAENPTHLEWNVSGTITEYRGANYLLIERAILMAGGRREPDP